MTGANEAPAAPHARIALILAILLVACGMRLYGLSRLPGVNGDEAWTGVQVERMIHHQGGTLWTGHGRPDNPFYFALLYLVHLVLSPSFFALRLPAALSGIALIPLSYWLVRRLDRDRWIACSAALLLACAPINIGYSRIGWGPTHVQLATLIATYFAMRRNWWGLALSFPMACLVHPTVVFSAVILAGPLVADFFSSSLPRRRKKWIVLTALGAAVSLAAVLALGWPGFYSFLRGRGVGHRLRNPQELGLFLLLFGELFSGSTVYSFLVEPQSAAARWILDLAFWGFAAAVVVGFVRLRPPGSARLLGLGGGILAGVVASYLILGTGAISPHHERYSLYLVAPTLLWCSLALDPLARRYGSRRVVYGVVALSAFWLASFVVSFLVPLEREGGSSHPTFRTARPEPKSQAFEWIVRDAGQRGTRELVVIADDWWNFWPLAYLAYKRPATTVRTLSELEFFRQGEQLRRDRLPDTMRAGAYLVAFADSPSEKELRQSVPEATPLATIRDAAGRELLRVWHIDDD